MCGSLEKRGDGDRETERQTERETETDLDSRVLRSPSEMSDQKIASSRGPHLAVFYSCLDVKFYFHPEVFSIEIPYLAKLELMKKYLSGIS